MRRQALSVTLALENVAWLKGRAGVSGESVSGLLDRIVTTARQQARGGEARSVVGTIDIDTADPLLARADAAVRAAFAASLGRPVLVREPRAASRARSRPATPAKRRA
jgi:hypothetical protein